MLKWPKPSFIFPPQMIKFPQKMHQFVTAFRSKVFCLAVSFSSSKSEKRSIQRHWELWKFLILLCFNRSFVKDIWIRKCAVKICLLKKKLVFAIMLFFCCKRNLRVVSSTYFCHFVVPPESHTRFCWRFRIKPGRHQRMISAKKWVFWTCCRLHTPECLADDLLYSGGWNIFLMKWFILLE